MQLVSNRKARHNYEILDTYEAGIVLKGTEIKSLRQGGGSLQEAYVRISKGELWLISAYIAPYKHGNIYNHDERQERKLLMHKREIQKLQSAVAEKGVTLVPLQLYLKNGRCKLQLAVGRGKKLHDKRQSLKEKAEKHRMHSAQKHN